VSGPIHRRGLLAIGVGAMAAPLVLRGGVSAAEDPFALGVASGEPWPDGFVIWTRLSQSAVGSLGISTPVRWQVAEDAQMGRVVAQGEVGADLRKAFAVHVEVAGLRPNRPYWYRFTALGAQSRLGRTRTAPGRGARVKGMRIVAASCAHWESGWFSAYRHMAEENPDLVLFLGDYIYEYSYRGERAEQLVRRHNEDAEVDDLAGYRARYAQYHSDPDLQTLHASAPCLATWDDHEVQNDYAGEFPMGLSVPKDRFLARRAAAYRAFYENMPLRGRSDPEQNDGRVRLYDRYRFGDLVQLDMLDGRQYRTEQPCHSPGTRRGRVAPATCAEFVDPARTMLGVEQERWLYDGFRRAAARWTMIGQQILVAPYTQPAPDGSLGTFTDGWSAYAANRRRMLDALVGARARNPVFLGGDMHAFVAADIKADPPNPASRTVAAEFVGTSVTSDPSPDSLMQSLPQNPHVRLFENRHRGYMSLDIDHRRIETRYQAISDRRDPRATVSTFHRFTVEAGRPGLITHP